ncbi:mitochondrial import inner membrane translocase subunit TIM44-2-like isoform X1 [Spinacia oleracea]|uniref:Mitochondrial import inner membrane translocase subunit TIM44-2-like isoform X1 n=1 Tax=Spinacia oleracea TaxID=3562 RepID=A0A9R0ILD2_SPIOL|nr:mitochondrial import inner membrane translocase subunit TIM44-2-like isoform X1 [Spinacia oleracea]
MASRKIVRDFFFSRQRLYLQFLPHQQLQQSIPKLRLITGNGYSLNRQFSVFNEFSNKIKGEATSNKEFQQSVKQLKEKAEELRGVKEDLKVRVKQTTEQLHKHVDGVWTEAEETAKKVSTNMKEKISSAKEEVCLVSYVKGTLGLGSQEPSTSNNTTTNDGDNVKDGAKPSSGEEHQQSEPSGTAETLFSTFRSTFASSSPKISSAFQKLKEAKVVDLAKKSYTIVKEELSGKPNRRKIMQYAASTSTGETSDRTEIVVVPVKQSPWNKKLESLKEKMRGNPMFRRITKMGEPVVTKSQELAEDLQERWETSDSPVIHKIQDINDKVFGENDSGMSFKEIRRRDPSFSLPEFVAEVQEVIKPVLNAYLKGDFKVLEKYCSSEVVERCKAEHKVFQSQDIFFDNKILHVSEVDVRETKMMGSSPIIILAFQTQQVYCVRNRQGSIKDGSQDTIHTVYYAWAMQQMDPEDINDDAIYSMWRLREMQQVGVAALI